MSEDEGVTPNEAVANTAPELVTPRLGKGTLGTWRSPATFRTLSRSTFCCEAGTTLQANRSRGAHASRRLNLSRHWEGLWAIYQPRSEPDSGKPTVRDRRGLLGTVADGGIRNPWPQPERAAMVTLRHPVRAPRFYPTGADIRTSRFGDTWRHSEVENPCPQN
jgi:hypothetical protein